MIATAVSKITNCKNETMFYLLLKTFIQATMMPLNKSKRCFDFMSSRSIY
ncbi:4-deoxy-L-threo-5-hexosulose-uronate ketol-isomerase [Salmonella enterica subsp. diarizonae]|uniref:4-deoxy-L-threo-5-hexosulose-uronate ketol-isomerase n=7 Tax=Salmonella enterica TaxID=28901 RepID=A0A3L7M501_SALDZ|nr:4-deoxy-L-threo-5-hexosulose-uronate ketol-isomerase [Salmonella enterica subsp. diarizonae serovar 65:c:z str. SA20044251]AXC66730.1 4-deoxy-L-threo-5-hexosulose-uronate ketol-isomerase [Salmonella enterica subsp. diarizonae serovar 59:z10:-]AXC73963.1 4-deoxy-L-threo-5-hexosulose-uronate ketol-isomerase [Salmonella enterica subsp. diarizonae serovar 48:i:z]AXD11049.1 4-deoxy-L-threo-5-hexosulose-uronate ketol-isomerase [Salmonella enterica]EAA2774367.1 4-deoxy-L-threo-5-hexosulose-uronate 